MEKLYVRASEKVSGIKTLGVQAYEALLNAPSLQDDLVEGLARAKKHVDATPLTDKRANCPQAASEHVNFLITTYQELAQNDILLKTVYLQILFANQRMFDEMQDLSVEQIADHFKTDVNNVLCKKTLDAKMKELQHQNEKPITYQK